MKIKICGLKRTEDVDYVNQIRPDWIGFVFAGQKRKIDYATAKKLKEHLDASMKAVGVFVNEDIEYIHKLASNGVIDVVQLHGDEDKAYIDRLRKRLQDDQITLPFIKAVRVQTVQQVLEAEQLPVEYLLLDAFTEDAYGGSGAVFDHNLIPDMKKPYLLAGGICYENIKGILDGLRRQGKPLPFCVDVSSSVETDGKKDCEKISRMVSLVHDIDV